ncbi:MAG TPA: DUF1702 family protein [Ktedonobacteraceae bacterium]
MVFSSNVRKNWRRSLFGISPAEITFARRGFYAENKEKQERLEQIAATFVQGYHAALEEDRSELLVPVLQDIDNERRGFAFEGAAMGLTLLDYFFPRKRRLDAFMQGPGNGHIYMLHVGAGWTLARLPGSPGRLMRRLDPLLCWLALDGYGFHQGFFSWRRFIENQVRPARLSGYALRAFDQGLGRSLWFVRGAEISQIKRSIEAFRKERRSDLWSGVGLAAAYAGGVAQDELQHLSDAAGVDRWHLAQGAAFAARARQRAGNPAAHTELACQTFCGLTGNGAAQLCDECLQDLPPGEKAYSLWRLRLRTRLSTSEQKAG